MAGEKGAVLLVEDEGDICWALGRILSRMGYHTTIAKNGQEALDLVESAPFHLGFVDAKLPDMEGTSLAARIRACRAGLPLVLISGYFYEDDERVRECIADGRFCAFVSKPFQISDIRKAVHLALGTD